MQSYSPLLSLCIPTNGIIELIFPVLESIYNQIDVDNNLFEVVIMDNGDNSEFKKRIKTFAAEHKNLVYKETEKKGFLNEIECYKIAKGIFIKFINHRTKLLPGTISYLIDFIKKNQSEKPAVYFANGTITQIKGISEYHDFDQYVKNLHIWSSWSTGMGFWKEDFEKLPKDVNYNELYPHTTILFNEKNKSKYIIDNTYLLDEIQVGHVNKGKYNVFYAFGVEYIGILCDLLRSGDITNRTFLSIKNDTFFFIADMYYNFILLKQPCSYDLSERKENLNIFYSYKKIKIKAFSFLAKKIIKFPFKIFKLPVKIYRKLSKRG